MAHEKKIRRLTADTIVDRNNGETLTIWIKCDVRISVRKLRQIIDEGESHPDYWMVREYNESRRQADKAFADRIDV